jgi:AraC-like DNA-binding protein
MYAVDVKVGERVATGGNPLPSRSMPSYDVVTREPHLALRAYVSRYVGYKLEGYPPGVHRGLPASLLTFIVQLDEPRAFVTGLRMSPVLLPHEGRHYGIAIDLTVSGTRALFSVPAGALTDTAADLQDLLGSEARTLSDRLSSCPAWSQRFDVLDQVLLSSVDPQRSPPSGVVGAWNALTAAPETRIEALAKWVGWSRRHFSEVFAREVGLPPRQLFRIIRFERSRHLVQSKPRTTMTEIALAAGYFDHSHMLHEWHILAGCRPDQWLAEELLSVQAESEAQAYSGEMLLTT